MISYIAKRILQPQAIAGDIDFWVEYCNYSMLDEEIIYCAQIVKLGATGLDEENKNQGMLDE